MPSGFQLDHTAGGTYVVYPDGRSYLADGPGVSNCTVAACPIEFSVYGYQPSLVGCGIVIALYALCMIVQIVLGFRYKTWGFMIAMLLGCISEIMGYAGRIMYSQNPWGNTGFIMQIVTITFAPVFFAGAIYVLISKIMNYVDSSVSRVKPAFIYSFFIIADIISLVLQAVGGSMSASSNGSSNNGVYIALAGLCFQVATLTFFCVVVIDYVVRARSIIVGKHDSRFRIFAAFLTLALITIFIRCCYRVYELSEGYSASSVALRNHRLFDGLETSMILITAYSLIGAHPGPVFGKGGVSHGRTQEKKLSDASDRFESSVGRSETV